MACSNIKPEWIPGWCLCLVARMQIFPGTPVVKQYLSIFYFKANVSGLLKCGKGVVSKACKTHPVSYNFLLLPRMGQR